jgi:hypothetical protein
MLFAEHLVAQPEFAHCGAELARHGLADVIARKGLFFDNG